MLFSTQFQLSTFLSIFFIVFAASFLFDVAALIYELTAKNNVVKNVFNFAAMSLVLLVFFFCVVSKNFGEFRWFCFLALALGVISQRMTFGKIIAKFYSLWYNAFEKTKQRINKKLSAKHGKRATKENQKPN